MRAVKLEAPVSAGTRFSAWTKPVSDLTDFLAGNVYGAQQRLFDLILGVSTAGAVVNKGCTLDAGGDNCFYQDCQWLSVHRTLKNLNPRSSDAFIDLGSGKGKALLIAGRLSYGSVVGIEIDEELCRHARLNIEKARSRLRAGEVQCFTANVLEATIPDNASVVFLCNPFVGETFRGAMSRVFESYDKRPRTLHVVYEHPWEHDWLLSTNRVIVEDVASSTWPARRRWWQQGDVIVTYRVVDSAAHHRRIERKRHGLLSRHEAIQRWGEANGHNFTIPVPHSDIVYKRF